MVSSKRSAASRHSPAHLAAAVSALVACVAVSGVLLAPEGASAQQGNGLFGGLFGGWSSQNSYSNRGRYSAGPYGNSYGDSYDYSNWFGSGRAEPAYSSRYRTLCVRTCDGYYFPISFSTTRAGLARDARRCEASCGAPAKLFYHRNPGADIQHMISIDGQPYSTMENAFRYREELVEGCRCTPQPWSEAAKQEYRRRAEAERNPGSVETAAQELTTPVEPAARAEVAGWNSYGGNSYNAPRREPRSSIISDGSGYGSRWWEKLW